MQFPYHSNFIYWSKRVLKGALLDLGVSPNPTGKHPLTLAAAWDRCEIAKLLLERGSNVNTVAPAENTALSLAVEYGYPEMTQILLESGANVFHSRDDGKTILLIAQTTNLAETSHQQVLELIKKTMKE